MPTTDIPVRRVSFISSRPFDVVVRRLITAIAVAVSLDTKIEALLETAVH